APGEHVIDQVRRADQAKPDHKTSHGTSNRREAAADLQEGRDENRLEKSGPESDDIGQRGSCCRLLFRPAGSLPLGSQPRTAIPKRLDDHANYEANADTHPIE